MRVHLNPDQAAKLATAIRRAGKREAGGQLFGEQLAPAEFVVTELTVQKKHGSFARFVVDTLQAARDAVGFFNNTAHRYSRFNYVGEWHSHPSFAVHPSGCDLQTMRALVSDYSFKGNFAVLMIARLDGNIVNAKAWVFDREGGENPVALEGVHGE